MRFRINRKRFLHNPLNNRRGVALMMAIFTVTLIMYLVTEISYETSVEYVVHSQSINRLKAYYAAEAGVEISLLRVNLYKKALEQYGSMLGENAGLLDPIWNFPFSWPPMLPEEVSRVDADIVQGIVAESFMEATYVAMIEDEGSKIDINDLDSPSEALRTATRNQLLNIFQSRMTNDPDWADRNRNLQAETLINAITDWLDDDTASLNGGPESAQYPNMGLGFPPNRSFRTIEELRMVAGMTDELFDLLAPHLTVYGMKGINPNNAPKEVLMSLHPEITSEVANAIIERRSDPNLGGPFTSVDDFTGFVTQQGGPGQLSEEILPLVFGEVMNFRITSTGQFGNAVSEITAIVFDLESIARRIFDLVKEENPEWQQDQPEVPGGGTPPPVNAETRPRTGPGGDSTTNRGTQRPPRIVYWSER